MKTKTVEYAYPTSPNADRFGFKDGCWTVELVDEKHMPNAIKAFATRSEAIENAKQIALEWNPLFLAHHPNID